MAEPAMIRTPDQRVRVFVSSTPRELHDDDLTGFGRLQQQLALAMVNSVLGQIRLAQGELAGAAGHLHEGLALAARPESLQNQRVCRQILA